MIRRSNIPLLSFFLGFILLLVALDFHAERRSPVPATPTTYTHPIKELHPKAVRVPVYHGKSDLFICSDSVATWYGHRAMEDWEREAYEKEDL